MRGAVGGLFAGGLGAALHHAVLFEAVVEATEEAIVNALVAAETMNGRDGNTAYKLPHDRLIEVMNNYRHTYTSR